MTSVALNEVVAAPAAPNGGDEEAGQNMVFCLELFVQHVGDVVLPVHTPAIAFRLLDFPIVLIHLPSDRPKNPDGSAALDPLTRRIDFHRGKSALFQLTNSVFRDLLTRVPLSVMLLDLQLKEASKLAGAASIDLSPLRREILLPLQNSPSGFQRGSFPLADLMGNRVGDVSLVLRLCCLGSALLPHLRQVPLLNAEKKRTVQRDAQSAASNQSSSVPLSSHSLHAVDSHIAQLHPLPRDETATAFRSERHDRRRGENEHFLREEKRNEQALEGNYNFVPSPPAPAGEEQWQQQQEQQQAFYYDDQGILQPYAYEQHSSAAAYELDQYAAQQGAGQFDPATGNPATSAPAPSQQLDPSSLASHKPQLSLGSATAPSQPAPSSKKNKYASVPEIQVAIDRELLQHNLRIAAEQSDPYSMRSVQREFPFNTQGLIIPQADEYSPPALFFYKGPREEIQTDLLQVEYKRRVGQEKAREEKEEIERRIRYRERSDPSHLKQQHQSNDASHIPQLNFHSREGEEKRIALLQQEERERRRRRQEQEEEEEEEQRREKEQKEFYKAAPMKSPRLPRSPSRSSVAPARRLSASSAAAAPHPPPIRQVDPTTPQRHQLRHHAPPAASLSLAAGAPSAPLVSAHGKKLSALEIKFRQMEATLAREKGEGAAKVARAPRLSIEERGRERAPPKKKAGPLPSGSKPNLERPMQFDHSDEEQKSHHSFPEAPLVPVGQLPTEYGQFVKRKTLNGSPSVGTLLPPKKNRPTSAGVRRAGSSLIPVKKRPVSSSGSSRPTPRVATDASVTPYAAAFESLQIQHETLQPSPQRSRSHASPRAQRVGGAAAAAAAAGGAGAGRRVQFEARIPEPPSPDTPPSHPDDHAVHYRLQPFGSKNGGGEGGAGGAPFDALLQEVESQLATRNEVLTAARRSAPAGEFLSPTPAPVSQAELRSRALGGADFVPHTHPVTESQLARVALDFLNDEPASRGQMSQYLLQQQLQGIHSMLQQPSHLIHDSIRSMSQEALQQRSGGSASAAMKGEPVAWDQYDLKF